MEEADWLVLPTERQSSGDSPPLCRVIVTSMLVGPEILVGRFDRGIKDELRVYLMLILAKSCLFVLSVARVMEGRAFMDARNRQSC